MWLELRHTSLLLAAHFAVGILILLVSWIAAAITFKVISRIGGRLGQDREDVLILSAQVARTALVTFGVVSALGTMGVNVAALVAGLGLTGFALGFAFRDALSNVLAGAMILFYRPFRRHDHISVTGFEGTVSETNLRYTVIQAEDARILIPNSTLLTNPIVVKQPQKELRVES